MKKTGKVLAYVGLTALIITLLTIGGFLIYECIKPAEKTETKTETEEKKEKAPEGMGANAQTGVSLNSVADAVITSYQPNTNYGYTGGMDVSHSDNPHSEGWGLMRFDLSSIPTNSVIDSASLKLHVGICGGPGPTMLSASQAINPWDEMAVTWANKPSYSGGVPKSSLCTLPSSHNLDVKEIAKKWVNYSEKNYGFVIHGGDSGNWDFGFCTRENNNFQLRPLLDIAYHEPGVTPPQGGNQGGNNTGSSGGNNQSATSTNPAASSQTVQPPTFSYLMKNGEKVEPPISEVVEIKEEDEVEAFGTAEKGLNVVLFVKGFAKKPTVDSEGNWSYKFVPSEIDTEESSVQIQAYTENGDTSSVTEIFTIKRVAEAKAKTEKKASVWQNLLGKYRWLFFGGLAVLFAILATTLTVLIVKRRKQYGNNPETAE